MNDSQLRSVQPLIYYIYEQLTRMTVCCWPFDAQGMSAAMRDFSQREEHSRSDSCFVVLMSHGSASGICGVSSIVNSDGEEDIFSTDDIYNCLNTTNCPGLRDKPKVILIQSCRGGELQMNTSKAMFIFRLFCTSQQITKYSQNQLYSHLSCTSVHSIQPSTNQKYLALNLGKPIKAKTIKHGQCH